MRNTVIISDLHFPYQHRDALEFLAAIKDSYGIEDAKNVGDVCDNHTSSYHEIEYGTMSMRDEYLASKTLCQELADIYPSMTVTLGNHCQMSFRKAKTAGIPLDHLKSYNDVYGVDWKWVDQDFFKVDKDEMCLMVHAMSKSTIANAKCHSFNTIQGHHHGTFGLEYNADKMNLRWSMTVGCLIEPNSPAFNYSKGNTNNRPILGCGAIIENRPIMIPMRLKKNGRWDGVA